MAKQKQATRTVTLTRTSITGEVLTVEVHQSKWELGRQRGASGNPWENAGWRLVEKKTAPKPVEVKPAKVETV